MTTTSNRTKKARTLLSLHSNGKLLILPNVWDVAGARILQAKGFPAIATASAAVSASLGYRDGERIKRSTMIGILSRIAQSVAVPVTADIESGYGKTLSALSETVRMVLDSGVVGINIEDSIEEGGPLRPVDAQCERINKVREVADAYGVHLVINARVDTFLSSSFNTRKERIEEAVLRARAYVDAGADCIYPVGPGDLKTWKELRGRIGVPLNILASPKAISLNSMQKLGINRVSFGPFIFRSTLGKFATIVDSLSKKGTFESFSKEMMSRDEVDKYLIRKRE